LTSFDSFILVVHYQPIMSFQHWSSILEQQQGIILALYAYTFMDRLNSESSGSEESRLRVGDNSFSSSSNSSGSSSSSSMSSSGNCSSLAGMSSIDSTFIVEEVIQVTVQMYECMETGIEDNTIQWGKRILIEDLSEDDAVTHLCFRKVHLQELANQL
jgi:hypothetical protein